LLVRGESFGRGGRLVQTVAAQAIFARDRHRQAHGFAGTPAGTARIALELRAASGTGEAASGWRVQGWYQGWYFCPICHAALRTFRPDFHLGFISNGSIVLRD
jgi:hypothetical protein